MNNNFNIIKSKEKLEILKDHIKDVCFELTKDYGYEETIDIRTSFMLTIFNTISCNDIDNMGNEEFKELLKKETKEMIKEQVRTKEFDVFSYKKEISNHDYLNNMTNYNKYLIELGLIYILSNYTKEDFDLNESLINKEFKKMGFSKLETFINKSSSSINLLLWGKTCLDFESKMVQKTLAKSKFN
ncbi:MAG: hypothetical protein PUC23_05245 [bacterium]|nr:hypothetical protein [bacterium]